MVEITDVADPLQDQSTDLGQTIALEVWSVGSDGHEDVMKGRSELSNAALRGMLQHGNGAAGVSAAAPPDMVAGLPTAITPAAWACEAGARVTFRLERLEQLQVQLDHVFFANPVDNLPGEVCCWYIESWWNGQLVNRSADLAEGRGSGDGSASFSWAAAGEETERVHQGLVHPLPLQTLQILTFEETTFEAGDTVKKGGEGSTECGEPYVFDAKELQFLLHERAEVRERENVDRTKGVADRVRRRLQQEEVEYAMVSADVCSCAMMAGSSAEERALSLKQSAAKLKEAPLEVAKTNPGDRLTASEAEELLPLNTRPFVKLATSTAMDRKAAARLRATTQRVGATETQRELLVQAMETQEIRLKALHTRRVQSQRELGQREEEHAGALQKWKHVVAHGRDRGAKDAEELIRRWNRAKEGTGRVSNVSNQDIKGLSYEEATKKMARLAQEGQQAQRTKHPQGEVQEVKKKEQRKLFCNHDWSRGKERHRPQSTPAANAARFVTRLVGSCCIHADCCSDFAHASGMWHGFEPGKHVQEGTAEPPFTDPSCGAVAVMHNGRGRGVCVAVETSTRLLIHIINGTNLSAAAKHLSTNAHRARLFCKIYVDDRYVGRTPFNQLNPQQLHQAPLCAIRAATGPRTQEEELALINDENGWTEPVAVGYSGARAVSRQQRRRQWERRFKHHTNRRQASGSRQNSQRQRLHPGDSAHHPVWDAVLEVPLYQATKHAAPSASVMTATAVGSSAKGSVENNAEGQGRGGGRREKHRKSKSRKKSSDAKITGEGSRSKAIGFVSSCMVFGRRAMVSAQAGSAIAGPGSCAEESTRRGAIVVVIMGQVGTLLEALRRYRTWSTMPNITVYRNLTTTTR
jgi:hypothetical protein